MTLSNVEIEKALARRSLIITPPPTKKLIGVTSIDVRLDAIIVVVRNKEAPLFFDPNERSIQDFWEEIGQEIDLRKRRTEPFANASGKRHRRAGYWLAPGEICLAFTHEHVSLPTDGEQVLQGEIWNRSRTARAFVHTHISAPHIKPGTDNKITLEIKNDGPFHVRLAYLDPIAQIGFEEVRGKVRQTASTFHGQKRPSGKHK